MVPKPPRFTDQQLGDFYETPSGRVYGSSPMGTGCELNDVGRAELRRIWDEFPEKRHLFDEEPRCVGCNGTGVLENDAPCACSP